MRWLGALLLLPFVGLLVLTVVETWAGWRVALGYLALGLVLAFIVAATAAGMVILFGGAA